MRSANPVRVWDLPTRLFHWLLVVLMAFSWWSAENDAMDWHKRFGIMVLGLLLFRLIWGVVGGSTARFGSFIRSPAAVLAYLRDKSFQPKRPGHNPLGAYSVIAMLGALGLQVITGLFAVDVDGLESGPLSYLVPFGIGRTAAEIHEISFTLLQILVAVHVLAILFYLAVRKRNLVVPMITGADRQLDEGPGALVGASPARLIAAALIAAGIAWWLSRGFGL